MAIYEHDLAGEVDDFMAHVEQGISRRSVTANLDHSSDHHLGDARMLVRAYERYSVFGSSRVSVTLSVLAVGQQIHVTAVGTGGSQAMFWKINTLSETNFLNTAVEAIESYVPPPDHLR